MRQFNLIQVHHVLVHIVCLYMYIHYISVIIIVLCFVSENHYTICVGGCVCVLVSILSSYH